MTLWRAYKVDCSSFFMVARNSSKQDIVFAYISLLYPAYKDFIGIIPSSILAFLHFILVSIAEIIFLFYGIHEKFYKGCCVWNVSLLHPVRKDFTSIMSSSNPGFFAFYIGIHCRNFLFSCYSLTVHIRYCVWNVFLFHPARKDFIGIISSSISAFLHFILVSIAKNFYFHVKHKQFHIGSCVWNVSLNHQARKDFIGIIPSSILAFLHFILVSIAEIFFFMVFMNNST